MSPETSKPAVPPKGAARAYARGSARPSISDLAVKYLPLVQKVVLRFKSYLPSQIEFDDLQSVALEAMMQCLQRYAEKPDIELRRILKHRTRGAILDELRKRDWASRGVRLKARNFEKSVQELEQELGRPAVEEEIRKKLELTRPEYHKLLGELRPVTFLDLDGEIDQGDGEGSNWYDRIDDPTQPTIQDTLQRRELAERLADHIEALPKIQKQVMTMYYFEEMRLAEIAQVFGLTESRICQIHTQTILSLRAFAMREEQTS